MLRSIMIGLAIAALLQVGLYSATSTHNFVVTPGVSQAAVDCVSATLLRLMSAGLAISPR